MPLNISQNSNKLELSLPLSETSYYYEH